jgi:hypothetical protein
MLPEGPFVSYFLHITHFFFLSLIMLHEDCRHCVFLREFVSGHPLISPVFLLDRIYFMAYDICVFAGHFA